ncbi:S8 family peptidase [Paenibacillus wulumuqiensis]|uniref:S8 family peptidase n=1 Tax=Paenibacillus wulumuqiensis TaxID=1567107 RepID=UPI000619F385|nr:S8 family peptidase [Paenibacillus wulumuqiensis]
MENNYLIKIIQKREVTDDRQTEGGGSGNLPAWVLRGEELAIRSQTLINDLSALESIVDKKTSEYQAIPVVIKAKMLEEALAKSHRSEIIELFERKEYEKAIGLSNDDELLIRIDDTNEFKGIIRNISRYENNARAISAIKEITAFDVNLDHVSRLSEQGEKYVLKVKLFDYKDYRTNSRVEEAFKNKVLSSEHIELKKSIRYSKTLTVHEIIVDELEAIQLIADFNGTLSIDPMPMFEIVEDSILNDESLEFPKPDSNVKYPLVGILDSGIEKNAQLDPWILGKSHSSVPKEYINKGHGTFVGGVVAFGDILEKRRFTGVDGCRLFDATVIPDTSKERISEVDLVERIREAIEDNKDMVKVWNMSLGSSNEADANEFSDFGIALDDIQDENEVLIVKSAGNCNNFSCKEPVGRITKGADSVRALTVGSIAHSQNVGDLSDIHMPSPFSRIGPGPSYIIKPELVHYGGNCGFADGNVSVNGINSLGLNGSIKRAVGTSFSTPRVSAVAADLQLKLEEDFDPLLIKALMIHSAVYPGDSNLEINQKLNHMGFGLPGIAETMLLNNPHEITVVLRDSISKGEYLEILDFPYPESLIDEQGFYNGQVILTLVSNPILDSQQGAEYCQSNIEVKFGTYDTKTLRDTTKPNIKNELGKDKAKNLLKSDLFSKKKSVGSLQAFSNREKMLVKYGDKFYPNKKYALDLTEMTGANKEKFLVAPKNWYLKLEGLFRSNIERLAANERSDLTQEFCMLLTIRDPQKTVPVYQEVSKLLDVNNFVHRNIKLAQNIDIRLDGDVQG